MRAFLDQSFPTTAHSLGEEARELRGHAPVRVWHYRLGARRPNGIGSKDLRFGLSAVRIGDPQRRDRLLLDAFAVVLLTLLSAAGESLGMDRHLKSNTVQTC